MPKGSVNDAEFPNEIWLAILDSLLSDRPRHTQGRMPLINWATVWRLRLVSRRLLALIESILQSRLCTNKSLGCRLYLFSSLAPITTIHSMLAATTTGNVQQPQNNLVVDELEFTTMSASSLPLAASFPLPQQQQQQQQQQSPNNPPLEESTRNSSSIFSNIDYCKVDFDCNSYDSELGAFIFLPHREFIEFDKLNTNDSIRLATIQFNGWSTIQQTAHHHKQFQNPYLKRLYRVDLHDLPGLHYLVESDAVLEYSVEPIEREIVKQVQKPGTNGQEKFQLIVRQTHYRLRLHRLLCTLGWLHNGLAGCEWHAVSSQEIGANRLAMLRRKFEQSAATAMSVHQQINWRHELIGRFICLNPRVDDLDQACSELCALISCLGGLADRRLRLQQAFDRFYRIQSTNGCGADSSDGKRNRQSNTLDQWWQEPDFASFCLARQQPIDLSVEAIIDRCPVGEWRQQLLHPLFCLAGNHWSVRWRNVHFRCTTDMSSDCGLRDADILITKWFSST